MAVVALFRHCTASEVRQLWSTLRHLDVSNKSATAENIYVEMHQSHGWTPSETSVRLADLVQSGLLLESNQVETVYQVPTNYSYESYPPHDWYCFQCEIAGTVICCSSCPRVYHEMCLPPGSYSYDSEFICPWCQAIHSRPAVDAEFCKQKLTQVVVLALTNGGSHFTQLPEPTWPYTVSQYRMLIASHMDLDEMQRKIDLCAYRNEKEFLADFHTLRHNVILLYGADSAFATLIVDLLSDVDTQLEVFVRQDGTGGGGACGEKENADRTLAEKAEKIEDMLLEKEKTEIISKPCNCEIERNISPISASVYENFCSVYLETRDRFCVNYIIKANEECDSERERLRVDMINQFKAELETTKRELDKQYAQKLKIEVQRLMEKHRYEVSHTKKTQWCCLCGNEAIYHCCWNTAYCSVKCQHESWASHKKSCRRKKDG